MCGPELYNNPGSSECKKAIVCENGKRPNLLNDVVSGIVYTASCPPGSYVCGFNHQSIHAYYFYCCKVGGAQVGHWRISTHKFNGGVGAGAIYTSTNDGSPPSPFNVGGTYNTFEKGISRIRWTAGSVEIFSDGKLLYNIGSLFGDMYDAACASGKIATGFYGWYGDDLDQASPMCNTMCVACSTCAAGKYVEKSCTTSSDVVCSDCLPGSHSSTTDSPGCTGCLDKNFQPLKGQKSCTSCSDKTSCPAGKIPQDCTKTSDFQCSPCPFLKNCVYKQGLNVCTEFGGKPSCMCKAGFQMEDKKCVQCPPGTFRDIENNQLCQPWADTCPDKGQFMVKGTRFRDSECISYPAVAPKNARINYVSMGWECNAGYQSMWR
jgi:hypothetical protein